jgi:GDPmannose 4,6-dehydratase
VIKAAQRLEMNINWEGSGVDEKGYLDNGTCIVEIDPGYFRPTEVETLLGDATKAREALGWVPRTSFEDLVDEMVMSDFVAAEVELRSAASRRQSLY